MIPHFTCHDVLQSKNFSPAEQEAFSIKTPLEWFKQATEPFEDKYLKLVIVAEGIDSQPEWVDFIKKHKNWEVQVHCWEHKIMKWMSEEELFEEIGRAKTKIEKTFDQKVTQFFPPKHYYSDAMWKACERLGLSLMLERYIPEHYFKYKNIAEVYFHFWSPKQIVEVRRILESS